MTGSSPRSHAPGHLSSARKLLLSRLVFDPDLSVEELRGFSRTVREIEWLLLADAGPARTYSEGRRQMLADFAFAEGGQIAHPRSWLDVQHYRLWGHDRPELLFLPEARFSCQSISACCDKDFRIEVPPAAQPFIDGASVIHA